MVVHHTILDCHRQDSRHEKNQGHIFQQLSYVLQCKWFDDGCHTGLLTNEYLTLSEILMLFFHNLYSLNSGCGVELGILHGGVSPQWGPAAGCY